METQQLIEEIKERIDKLPAHYQMGAIRKYKDFVEWLKEELKDKSQEEEYDFTGYDNYNEEVS